MSQPPYSGPPYSGPPYGEQPSSGQPYQGQPPSQGGQQDPGRPYPGQPYPGQPYPGQPHPGQPYPDQTYPGQPNPDVPSSVPPGYPPTQSYPSAPDYGQPQYGQPQYGQPQYGEQGYGAPGFPPPMPVKKKSKALPIVLVSVAVVLVLCVGGSIAIALAVKNNTKANKNPVSTSDTTVPTIGPTKNVSSVKIVEPKTFGGRPKLTGTQFEAVADELRSSLKSEPGATTTVASAYGTVGKDDIVIVAAAKAPIDDPDARLDQTFYGVGVGGLKVSGIVTAPTGSLGGAAKCGSAKAGAVDAVFCTWADNGSMGMIIYYTKSITKARAEFPALRAQVEQKS